MRAIMLGGQHGRDACHGTGLHGEGGRQDLFMREKSCIVCTRMVDNVEEILGVEQTSRDPAEEKDTSACYSI